MVGIFTSNRQKSQFEAIAGYCLNTIVVRAEFSANPTFKQAVLQISVFYFLPFFLSLIPIMYPKLCEMVWHTKITRSLF